MSKRKPTSASTRAVPYPAAKTPRAQELMLGVIKGLGKLPSNDNEIEDRVLACVMVAWGELAAMQNVKRQAEIVSSLGELGKRVVAKLAAATGDLNERAQSQGQTLVEMLYEAVAEGAAQEHPFHKRPRPRR